MCISFHLMTVIHSDIIIFQPPVLPVIFNIEMGAVASFLRND